MNKIGSSFNQIKEFYLQTIGNKPYDNKRIIFLSIFIIFFLFLLSLIYFQPTWGINDDVMMAMQTSGKGFSNTPTEHIFFTNIIIGFILLKLYQYLPFYPWYGFYTFGVLFVSFASLFYAFLTYRYSKTRIIYFLLYFVLFGLWLIRMPQFTTNAFMIGMSGIFLFYTNLFKKNKLSFKINFILSVFLITVSSLIRLESFFLVIILSFPFLIVTIFKSCSWKQTAGRIILFSILIFTIVVACHLLDKNAYLKDNSLIYVLEKNKLSTEIIDNNRVMEYSQRTKYIFDNVGWSINDFILLRNWFNIDNQIFSLEKKKKVLSEFENISTKRTFVYFELMFKDKYFYGAILLILFFIIQIDKRNKNMLSIFVSIIISLCIIIYLGYFVRLPERVYIPILSFLTFLPLLFIENDFKIELFARSSEKIKLVFVILFISLSMFIHYKFNAVRKHDSIMFKEYISQLQHSRNSFYLVWIESFPLHLLSVFDNLNNLSGLRMLSTYSDFNDREGRIISKEFNVTNFRELVEGKRISHIGNITDMAIFSRYLKEHYNMDVAFRIRSRNPFYLVFEHVEIIPEMNNKIISVPVNMDGIIYKISILQE